MDDLGQQSLAQAPDPTSGGNALDMIHTMIPEEFKLSRQDPSELQKLTDEVMDKVQQSESELSSFYGEWDECASSWRMAPRELSAGRPKGLFNSKSGETNRGINTLANVWFRMLTASDPFFEAVGDGLDQNGMELTEDDLFGVETVLSKQLIAAEYKRKLLRSLRSLSAFGTVVVENPYVVKPNIEYTDFVHRSMLLTHFDPFVYDINYSKFLAFIDFPSDYTLRQLAATDPDTWDKELLEKSIKEFKDAMNSEKATNAYARIQMRKTRAGYNATSSKTNQLCTYMGVLDSENGVLRKYADSKGMTTDIRLIHWTIRILGSTIISLHPTPYGDWHRNAKVASVNEWELEPIGYGVGRLGRKYQREMDLTQSRMNDILMFSLFSMFKVGKFAGLNANQLTIKPWNVIELEDINQFEPIRPDIQSIQQAVSMLAMMKEDFRSTTGASTNLQAQQTNSTATEAGIAQTEAIRQASVTAEVIAETLVRMYLEDSHINNTNLLETDIFVALTGSQKPMVRSYNRDNLPSNVGFKVKVTTDKDFRPERQKNLLQGLQLATSIRNDLPEAANVVRPLIEEWFRSVGINPRRLNEPIPVADQLARVARRQQMSGNLGNELAGEKADESSGYPNVQSTPIGPVPTSPLAAPGIQ